MSADLVLRAAPTDDEWLARWQRFSSVVIIGDPMDSAVVADDDGFWRLASTGDAGVTSDAYGAFRSLHVEPLPWCFVGQVSWLKWNLYDDDRYIPASVQAISIITAEAPILTPAVASHIMIAAGSLPNRSIYSGRSDEFGWRGTVKPQHLKRWLSANMTCRLVSESW